MSELTCKCGHAVSEHQGAGAMWKCPHITCYCQVNYQPLHRAIVEAAMRFRSLEDIPLDAAGEDLLAAVRALRESTR